MQFKDGEMTGGSTNDPAYLKRAIADSLERLGFAPDLLYIHRIDPSVAIEDTVKLLEEHRKAGKVCPRASA